MEAIKTKSMRFTKKRRNLIKTWRFVLQHQSDWVTNWYCSMSMVMVCVPICMFILRFVERKSYHILYDF